MAKPRIKRYGDHWVVQWPTYDYASGVIKLSGICFQLHVDTFPAAVEAVHQGLQKHLADMHRYGDAHYG